jgi:hypothetical protein
MTEPNYVVIALKRVSKSKDENTGMEKESRRLIVKNGLTVDEVVARAKTMCDSKGVWRIYRSVNKRNFDKAFKKLQVEMIMNPEFADHVDSKWKSILMGSDCKAERKFLVDIDTKDFNVHNQVISVLNELNIELFDHRETVNGFHIVCDPFDPRKLSEFKDVEVKKDALLFLESFEV